MDTFATRWERTDNTSLSTKVKEAVRPPGPLKPRLDAAIKRIDLQVQRLDQASNRFNERDRAIFNRIVEAYSKHDSARASVLANELAEIRKMEQMIIHARLALEQITLRLRTVTELGDVAVTLLPVVGVIRDIKTGISSISPQAEKELGEIGNLLSGIVVDAGAVTGSTINFESANEDSQKILEEAAAIAEQRMKETFPDLPGKARIGEVVSDRI
ncbi:MAG: Snf7 family protein [Candidatus Bathyarchaeia archaeon]